MNTRLLFAVRDLFRLTVRAPALEPAALAAPADAELADFAYCSRQQRPTAHAMRADGSRRCWDCGLETHGRTDAMTQILETTQTTVDALRPAQQPCPNCTCCTVALCERGRHDVGECMAHTRPQFTVAVAGCPCSSAKTRGTHAWRVEMLRITKHATENPMPVDAEEILRALTCSESFTDPGGFLRTLRARGYVSGAEPAYQITDFGRRYLAARTEKRLTTPVEIEAVDTRLRTARVVVVGWHIEQPVTVLLDQLTNTSGLSAEELPNRFLEAKANCRAADADDIVLTRIQLAPPLPADWMATAPAVPR